jgi:hypothetical protein
VTQPLLLEQLREWGIAISTGQLNELLLSDKEPFHLEKDALLSTALAVSSCAATASATRLPITP